MGPSQTGMKHLVNVIQRVIYKDELLHCICTRYAWRQHRREIVTAPIEYSLGDLITLMFDFMEGIAKIYHNGEELNSQTLFVKKVWVGISLQHPGSGLEMIDYRYH